MHKVIVLLFIVVINGCGQSRVMHHNIATVQSSISESVTGWGKAEQQRKDDRLIMQWSDPSDFGWHYLKFSLREKANNETVVSVHKSTGMGLMRLWPPSVNAQRQVDKKVENDLLDKIEKRLAANIDQ